MQEIREAAKEVTKKIQSSDIAKRDFIILAQKIADVSLEVFTGELLDKALVIAKSLVEFEDEYWKISTHSK